MVRRKIQVAGTGKIISSSASATRSICDPYMDKIHHLQTTDDIYPLNAPDIPALPHNSDFIAHAQALGDTESELIVESNKRQGGTKEVSLKYSDTLYKLINGALRDTNFIMPVTVGSQRYMPASFVPGHLWGAEDSEISGPRKADVMIINKMPWSDEISAKRCFAGPDGALLLDLFKKLGVRGLSKFYVTHLVKFMPPNWQTNLRAVWVKDGLHLLYHEIKIVNPKYILCLGSDAIKALVGKSENVTTMDNKVAEIVYSQAFTDKYLMPEQTAKLMGIYHPKSALHDQSVVRQLEVGLSRFGKLISGKPIAGAEKVYHEAIYNHEELLARLVEIENLDAKQDSVIAVDAEWEGEHPGNAGSYMRTMQMSWLPKHALGIVLRKAGGAVSDGFADSHGNLRQDTVDLLNTFFNGGKFQGNSFRPKRVVGHFFNADLEWLIADGLDLRKPFSCPLRDIKLPASKEACEKKRLYRHYVNLGFKPGDVVPAWYRTEYEGGADTGLMAHAIEETAVHKLEILSARYTSAPRYEVKLQEWIVDFCKDRGISKSDLEGYGECPDDILLPYGMYDADVTLRLFYKFDVLLNEDYDGNNCREAFWESQIAAPAVLEIHRTGISVDKERIKFLTDRFVEAKTKLEGDLKDRINWPDFNIRSVQHVRELLFGHRLNGRLDKETGNPCRIRPAGAMSLGLTPLFSTSKPPRPWSQIQEAGKEHENSPSTDKQSLSLLAQAAPSKEAREIVGYIRDCRFLDQVLKTTLRPPIADEATGEYLIDDSGEYTYSDGLMHMCCDDGRLRTHIYQTKETGRWSSARPNLQNISKKRDPDYKRLLGDGYRHSLRSILKAAPGHVLIEADYIGAELFGMAVMSGDELMIEHAMRNQLPDDDPNFYDIHSNIACFAFNLNCSPTKSGLKEMGKSHLRIVAKSVIFGIAYGRGAKAIATAAKEEGIDISVSDAQSVIDAIFQKYSRLQPFFQECRDRATGRYIDPVTGKKVKSNVLCNCYGRYRRFPDMSLIADSVHNFERQAMNFPIQSLVASAVSRAISYMYDYRVRMRKRTGHDMYRIILQIHDAILLEVPYKYVKHVCEVVFPECMRRSVPIYPTSLDGLPLGTGPYYLGLDVGVMDHWGETVKEDQAKVRGLPTGHKVVDGCSITYSEV